MKDCTSEITNQPEQDT